MKQTNELSTPSTPSTERVSTAMQELIEDVKANMMGSIVALQESGLTEKERSHYNATIIVAKDVIAKAKYLLPKERKGYEDAYNKGVLDFINDKQLEDGADYFTQTFKQ